MYKLYSLPGSRGVVLSKIYHIIRFNSVTECWYYHYYSHHDRHYKYYYQTLKDNIVHANCISVWHFSSSILLSRLLKGQARYIKLLWWEICILHLSTAFTNHSFKYPCRGVTDIYFSTFQVRIIGISVQLKMVSINKHSDKAYICSTPSIGLLFNIAFETLPVLLGFYCIVTTIVPPSSAQMRSFVIAFVCASLFQMVSVEHVH